MTMMPIQMPRKNVFYQFSTKEMMLGTMWLPTWKKSEKTYYSGDQSFSHSGENVAESGCILYGISSRVGSSTLTAWIFIKHNWIYKSEQLIQFTPFSLLLRGINPSKENAAFNNFSQFSRGNSRPSHRIQIKNKANPNTFSTLESKVQSWQLR